MHDESEIIERRMSRLDPEGGIPGRWPPAAPTIAPARDPIALANATIKAVDQIGEAAAVEIEQSADELEASAHELGDKLRRLAAAMRQHTKMAGDDVEQFARQAIDATSLVRELKQRLDGERDEGSDAGKG